MDNISEESKLGWGDVDFIEEACPFSDEPLEFKDIEELSISEAESPSHSKYKLLGVVKGCMAPIGELSRNGRLYESTHWGKVLANPMLQERIAGRKFFGMISHENKKIDDRNFKAGEISHICSVLEVRNDDNGKPYLYGELDILDTPAGRILKAMYEGGAGLYVSTRAAGKLVEAVGKPYKIVDSNSYYIDSIDFVLNPGFLKAKPVYGSVVAEGKEESEVAAKVSDVENNIVEKMEETMKTLPESSIEELKGQIDQLAKIIEKVVDDVYEEAPKEEEKKSKKAEVLPAFIKLMAESDISEEAFSEILDMIKGSI